jgi:hypothetical protein
MTDSNKDLLSILPVQIYFESSFRRRIMTKQIRCSTLVLILLLLTSCNQPEKKIINDNNQVEQSPIITATTTATPVITATPNLVITAKNMYDPHFISVGDTFGMMTAKTISVKDNDGQTTVNIEFESDPIQITGEFNNFIGDYHVLNFIPDEESEAKFPHHNLFVTKTSLNFFDEKILKQFEGYKIGTATIKISGYHEVVSYKDDTTQNSNFIELISIQSNTDAPPTETPPNITKVQDLTNDCSKVVIPTNVERDTLLDIEKELITVYWLDQTTEEDVGVKYKYTDQNCSESAKQMTAHLLGDQKK